ncbi:hypothetical protein [Chitinophaga nivalis]|uniref:Uncharacterized protein n=1 Tax=Chitinophaga nivalis TaxID=2991709 RepID=A0ABT3IXM9_9BACT|nr:hypothetical protein [Chitinophaga nivalis]MCW3461821.1 hypothetical protein [Chitinophaga nivalis]MCW3488485.1 hypothetical protein [Chitinophaga nivalis]
MKNAAEYRKKAIINEMILAFVLFKDEGIKAVERMYPQHVLFVLENKNKATSTVQDELLHLSDV